MSDKTKLQKHINAKHKQLLDHPQCVMVCTILRLRGLGIASFHIVTECIQIPFSFNVLCQLSVWILFFSGRKNILKKKKSHCTSFNWWEKVHMKMLCWSSVSLYQKKKLCVTASIEKWWGNLILSATSDTHCSTPDILCIVHVAGCDSGKDEKWREMDIGKNKRRVLLFFPEPLLYPKENTLLLQR